MLLSPAAIGCLRDASSQRLPEGSPPFDMLFTHLHPSYPSSPIPVVFLQVRWTQLVSQGGLDGLGPDQLVLTLACWLSEVSSILNSETDFLRRSEDLFMRNQWQCSSSLVLS